MAMLRGTAIARLLIQRSAATVSLGAFTAPTATVLLRESRSESAAVLARDFFAVVAAVVELAVPAIASACRLPVICERPRSVFGNDAS